MTSITNPRVVALLRRNPLTRLESALGVYDRAHFAKMTLKQFGVWFLVGLAFAVLGSGTGLVGRSDALTYGVLVYALVGMSAALFLMMFTYFVDQTSTAIIIGMLGALTALFIAESYGLMLLSAIVLLICVCLGVMNTETYTRWRLFSAYQLGRSSG